MTARDPRALTSVCLLYAGVLIGFSFIATPAKFFSPGVSTPDLLIVGRTSFSVFGWVELAFLLLAGGIAFRQHRHRGAIAAVAVVLGAQHLLLRPILDARVDEIIGGADPAPSRLHHVYGELEIIKLLLVLWAARAFHDPSATRG